MSLGDCIAKLNTGKPVFDADEIKKIQSLANKNIGKMSADDAARHAVQALLDEAIAERHAISNQIKEAMGLPVDTAPVVSPAEKSSIRIIDGIEYDGNADNFGLKPVPFTLKDNDPLLIQTSTINTLERIKMRNNIVDQHFDGIEPAFMRKPVAYIMGGGGASGKGTIGRKLANSGKIPQTNIVHLDPDEIKANIKEYQLIKDAGDSRAAGVVHEESSAIAARIRARAIAGGYDFINDVTLGDPVKAIKYLQELKDAGYEVRLYGVTIDPATAVIRADLRARKPDSGRYVPVSELLKAHKGFALNFEKYAAIVDHAELYENTDAPIKIAIKSQDKLDVIDQITYNQVVKRSEVVNEQAKTINEVGSLSAPQPSRADENQQSGNNGSSGRLGSLQGERARQSEGVSGKAQVTTDENQPASTGSNEGQGSTADEGIAAERKSGSVHRGSSERDIVRNNVPLLADSQEARVRPSGDADGGSGDPQRSNSASKGSRAVRNAGVPAGRDIPAKSGANYQFTDSDLDYKGSWITKAAQNVDAVELVKKLDAEGRNATRAEQSILAKFVGWGAGEIRNQIFAPDLDTRLSAIKDYENTMNALGDNKSISGFSGNFYAAFKVLHAKDQTLNYYTVKQSLITRDMLEKAKPDMTLGKWGALRDRLKAIMTAEEWKTAERSTQYAHYTGKEVVQSMWQAMDQFGFKGGSILEPGAGMGVFPGLMNSAMANNSVYTGIEFDVLTGAILKHLQPDERILVESFIESSLPDNFYDVAIGNPPFSNSAVLSDPRYKKNGFALHDYFFAKTMDKVKPGGILMFVSSRYTMDKQGDKAREYLAERADFLGAIRLPETAFKKNAGTDVVTDILFLRKKVPDETFEGHPWMKLDKVAVKGGEHLINEYFAANPSMVLGEGAITRGRFSDHDYSVLPNKDTPIEEQLASAIAKLPKDVFNPAAGSAAQAALIREIDWNPKARKEGNFYVADDGGLMQVENRAGVPANVKGADNEAMVRDFVPLRDAVNQAQYDQLNNGDWEKSLAALQKTYKAFVKKHGNILQNTEVERKSTSIDEDTGEKVEDVITSRRFTLLNKIDDDPEYTKVMALENINDETGVIKESDFLTKRTLDKRKDATISTPHDAMLSVLNDTGKINIAAIAERIGLSKRETIESLGSAVYQSPSGEWQTEDEYLSGDVKDKLKQAQEAAKSNRRYERNVEALMAAQPAPVSSADIKASLGMNWIPAATIEQFLHEKTGVKASILYNEHTGSWKIDLVSGHKALQATADWGTPKRNAGDIMEAALTGRPIRITETNPDTKKSEFMADQTEAANQKLKQMREAFAEWMWQDGARADKMVQLYNDKFNTLVSRKFDGRHLTLPGTTSTIQVFDHVKRGAWRIIQTGNTYLAHAVGSGKTWQMVIAAMEQKRLGMINKPMMVVPNHMLQQFAQEWLQLYPAARLMVADEKQFHTDNRRRFVSRVAMSDLDGVIITHSAFKLLDLDPEFKTKMIQEELDYMEAARDGIMAEDGGDDPKKIRNPKVRDIQNRIERMEEKLKALTSGEGKDQNVRFDETGVDQLHIDEAHEFRKLAFVTARQVKGIDSNGSDKSFDLYMKTRWLEEKYPKRSLVMASGTMVTNTLAEIFSVQRFMQPNMLAKRGLNDFDAWASMFGEEHSEIEADASGKYAPVTRFAKFVNVPELTQMIREFADVLTSEHLAEMLGDKRPKVVGGSRKLVVTPQVDDYLTYKDELAHRLEVSRKWKPSKDVPNNPDPIIKIIGDGRLAAIDMRFIDPSLPSDPNSKLNQMIDGAIRVYKETADSEYFAKDGKKESIKGGSQMIFSDLGFGAGVAANRGFNARAWLEKRMRDAGVAPKDIAFMGDYKKSVAKVKLFRDVNAGKVRILIGSSKSMGTGVNAQQRLIALHHLDTPWFPADLEQREGRIVRQGNKNPLVQIYAYSTKGSYDTVMWQLLARKQRFIDQALSGDSSVRELDDISETSQFQMATAMTAGDERAIRLAGLKSDIEKYQRLSRAHQDTRMRMRESYLGAKYAVTLAEGKLPEAEKLAAKVQDLSGINFKGKVGSKQFDTRKELGEALLAKLKEYSDKTKEGRDKVGELSGFPLEVIGKIDRNSDDKPIGYYVRLTMKIGEDEVVLGRDPAEDPVGMTIRATNALAKIARMPDEHKQNIADAKSKINSLESRLDTPFQFTEELATKQQEVAELEAAMMAGSMAKDVADAQGAADGVKPSRATSETTAFTPAKITEALRNSPFVGKIIDKLITRGENGKRGGVVIGKDIADTQKLFKEKTGRELGDDVLQSRTDQTGTPSFKNWFGDSKVVDADGKPLVVYHGTGADITEYDNSKAPVGTDKNRTGAMWFTTAPEVAGEFAGAQRGETVAGIKLGHSNIMPVFLTAKNPYIDRHGKYARGGGLTSDDIAELKADGYDSVHWPQAAVDLPDTTDQGPVKGYYRNRHGEAWGETAQGYPDQWAVFEPAQIKSAIGNTGAFDPKNTDIRYSKSGVVQGLYDPKSGITFLIANHLNETTAAPVLLHEILHAVDTPKIQQQAVRMIEQRNSPLVPATMRKFLNEVYAKTEAAGVVGNDLEQANYIVEHALNVGRQDGFSKIDGSLFGHLTTMLGKTISDFVRNWVARVRAALFERGADIQLTTDDYIALARAGLKRAARGEVNAGGDVVSRSDKAARFYSQLRKVMQNAPDKIFGNGKQVALWLQANAGKSQIKQDEIFWSGITDWLGTQDKVTKADVLAYLDANGVQIKVEMLGEEPSKAERDELSQSEFGTTFDNLQSYQQKDILVAIDKGKPKHASLQLPGGEKYREMILTVPTATPWGESDTTHFGDTGKGKTVAWIRFNERIDATGDKTLFIEELQSKRGQSGKKEGLTNKSPNQIEIESVIRAKEIKAFDKPAYDKKIKDYAWSSGVDEEKRNLAYKLSEAISAGEKFKEKYGIGLTSDTLTYDPQDGHIGGSGYFPSGLLPYELIDAQKKILAEDKKLQELKAELNAIPSAPFVTDTKAWTALALKRMISYAIDNGFQKIAWTNGTQQAARYDLSKQVDRVEYWPQSKTLTAYKDGIEVIKKSGIEKEGLSDAVGKDVAKKLLDEPMRNGVHQLRGDDLKVGGEGMKGFYDQIVPQVANEILRKTGGGKVETVGITTPGGIGQWEYQGPELSIRDLLEIAGDRGTTAVTERQLKAVAGRMQAGESLKEAIEREGSYSAADAIGGKLVAVTNRPTQQGFTITPEMRSKVTGEGMPLFSRNTTQDNNNAQPRILRMAKKATMEEDTSKLDHVLGGKFLFQAADTILSKTGAKALASGVYTNLLERVGAESFADLIPETIKAGMVSDYGLTPEYQDRKAAMKAAEAAQNRKNAGMVEMLAGLTRNESRVAYQWMQEKPDTATENYLLAQLPQESREVLGKLKDLISSLGKEAVRLGQLSPEAFERNNMAYVNRSYAKHVIGTEGKIAAFMRGRAAKIKGNQYKGRGIFDEVTMKEVGGDPMFWRKLQQGRADNSLVGEKLVRYERRDASTEVMDAFPGMESKQLGKLREVVYWPVSQAVPVKFGSWVDAGTFEVRGTKGDKLVIWRDFTRDERTRMGELDEVRYAVAQTLQMMVHDIEIGRMFEWVAKEYGKVSPEGNEADASESMLRAYGKDDWVQVPSSSIKGTTTKKYGALAGLYVPGPIWNDMRQVNGIKFDNPILAAHESTLRFWKKSKTAWSPGVHTTNVMSNFVIADWNDLKSADLAEGLKVWANKNKPGYKEIYQRFEDSGALGGMFLSNEVMRDEIAKQLEEMKDELMGAQADAELSRLSKVMHLVTMAGMVPVKAAKGYASAMEDAYQFEDAVFRLASFVKSIRYGKTDIEAGRIARHSFLNYDINAPWVQAARHSVLPFISFFYRAMPKLASTVKNKPWKIVKLLAFYQLASMIGTMLAGDSDDDEEKNRKLLPEEKSGRIWGVVPKMIRLPWNSDDDAPIYLDVRRWVPVGDVVDVGQSSSSLPSWATPGGILPLLAEVFVFNKAVFTKKNITEDIDSIPEAAEKKLAYVFKSMMPNVPLPNPLNMQIGDININPFGLDQGNFQSYAWSGIEKAVDRKEGMIGEVRSTPQAIASAFGIKVAAYPEANMKAAIGLQFQASAKKIEGEMKKDARDYGKLDNPTPAQKAAMERGMKRQAEKLNELAAKVKERVN